MSKKLTTEGFILKAKAVHGDKYDYSKVNYINNYTKIIIICSEHGKFEQIPADHLRSKGCPKCVGLFMDTEYFIEKVIKKHGDRYDYSKVDYVNAHTKITIICPEHGEFEQTPASHLQGNGCPKCNGQGFIYLSFEELKKHIISLGIKTRKEYFKWWEENKKWCQKNGIPKIPDRYYKNNM